MQKITPFLWFNNNLEDAMTFYAGVFKQSKIGKITRNNDTIISATFELEGQTFIGLNGGPHFSFTPAISLFVNCDTQEEVDTLWSKLSEGGEEGRCGWLKDKFGLSWQIIPTILGELLNSHDKDIAQRVMQAMMGMSKIDTQVLKKAAQK